MIKKLAVIATLVLVSTSVQSVPFYTIDSISSSTQATDLFPANNLIQGPGAGFDASEPHDKTNSGSFVGNWVTDAPGGFPADYIAVAGMPVLTIDLGLDRMLS
jgi:hypothetical protein